MPVTRQDTANARVTLPALAAQAERLVDLGVHEVAGLTARDLRDFASAPEAARGRDDGLLAVHPDAVPASALAQLMTQSGKSGFIVEDMQDVDRFVPLGSVAVPGPPLYLLTDLDRGDHLANWSPDEALPALIAQGRSPLLLTEGIHWVLQLPAVLERNHCFMMIGSRLPKENGTLDARIPALWISNGSGRDGRERRNAPKVGWCWAGNRHTWLGFASTTGRHPQLS